MAQQKFYDAKQVAKITGRPYSTVIHHIQAGNLEAKKFGIQWMVEEDALKRFNENPPTVGRPPWLIKKFITEKRSKGITKAEGEAFAAYVDEQPRNSYGKITSAMLRRHWKNWREAQKAKTKPA